MDSYVDLVGNYEGHLESFAKRSFDNDILVDSRDARKYFMDMYGDEYKRARVAKRTPLQIERDRILYSSLMRKLNDKQHVLYYKNARIKRNYTTHIMRFAQVTRAICRALMLNEDFAEALALGSKSGACPFVHVSKKVVSDWMVRKLAEIDSKSAKAVDEKHAASSREKMARGKDLPGWLQLVSSPALLDKVEKYLPYSVGVDARHYYSSGKQSFWMLMLNPYLLSSNSKPYTPETAYGIWRHSLMTAKEQNSFYHRSTLTDVPVIELSSEVNGSLEAMVVQNADDITWVIENLNEANQLALHSEGKEKNVFMDFKAGLNEEDTPGAFYATLDKNNPGLLYTYFIDDFISTSEKILAKAGRSGDNMSRQNTVESKIVLELSKEGKIALELCKDYLTKNVFNHPKLVNRNQMLTTISDMSLDYLYNNRYGSLEKRIGTVAAQETWPETRKDAAMQLISDDVHRLQVAINAFSEMTDLEVFEFVGIETI